MEFSKKLLITALASTMLVGCTMPGSNLSVDGKKVINTSATQQTDISDLVNVYPLYADNVAKFRQKKVNAQNNPALDAKIAGYEYRIGPGRQNRYGSAQ